MCWRGADKTWLAYLAVSHDATVHKLPIMVAVLVALCANCGATTALSLCILDGCALLFVRATMVSVMGPYH